MYVHSKEHFAVANFSAPPELSPLISAFGFFPSETEPANYKFTSHSRVAPLNLVRCSKGRDKYQAETRRRRAQPKRARTTNERSHNYAGAKSFGKIAPFPKLQRSAPAVVYNLVSKTKIVFYSRRNNGVRWDLNGRQTGVFTLGQVNLGAFRLKLCKHLWSTLINRGLNAALWRTQIMREMSLPRMKYLINDIIDTICLIKDPIPPGCPLHSALTADR